MYVYKYYRLTSPLELLKDKYKEARRKGVMVRYYNI
jgi:hypothetical protein